MKNLALMLFVNEHKKEDKHPDYHVKIKIGDQFEDCGAGWKKTSAKGTKFLSLSIQTEPIRKGIADIQKDQTNDW